jgi:hypothetical protein
MTCPICYGTGLETDPAGPQGDGIVEKEVGDLRIKYGAGSSAAEAVNAMIQPEE